MRKLFYIITLISAVYWQGGQGTTVRFGPSLPTGASVNQIFIINDGSGAIYVCVHSPTCAVVSDWVSISTGQAPSANIVIAPITLNFGSGTTAVATQPQPIAITNIGNIAVTVSGVSFGGSQFSEVSAGACTGVLKAGATCVDLIQMTAAGAGAISDTLTVTSNAPIDSQNPLTVALSGNGTASTTFPVALVCSGLGNGEVVDGTNLDCTCQAGVSSGVCQQSYVAGPITLTATADPISTFNTYTGAGLSTSPGTFTVSQAQTVSAQFDITPVTFVVGISCVGQGTGTITSSVGGISATCTGGVLTGTGTSSPVLQGTSITFTENPSGGCSGGACTFSSWGGITGCTTASTCVTTVNSNLTVSASFALAQASAALQLIQTIPGGTAGANKITGNFASAQQVGDTNIITIQLNDATTTVSGSVTDTSGNTYTQVPVCSPRAGNGHTTAMYYSANIVAAAAGANTVTVNLSASPSYRAILAAEYSGLSNTPFDACASATGAGSTFNAGNLVSTGSNDLLTASSVGLGSINSPSAGWTQQIKFNGNDYEDRQGVAAGTYNNSTVSTGSGFSSISAAWLTTGTNPAPTFSFTVACGGNGAGTVTASGINVTCSNGSVTGTSSAVVAPNSTATLAAVPNSGSTFITYTGAGCTTSPNCTTAAITTNTTVTANFSLAGQQNYFVNVSTGSDSNSGLCAVSGAGCSGPWQHISKAISTFSLGASGTTINVASGTYTEAAGCAGNTPVFCVNRGGTPTQRLVIKCTSQWSVPSSTGCLLRNNGGTNGAIEVIANNVDVGAINRFGFDYSNAGGNFGIYAHCSVANSTCPDSNNVRIVGNYMHDIGQTYNDSQGGVGCPSSGAILAGPSVHLNNVNLANLQVIGNRVSNFGLQSRAKRNGGNCNFAHGLYISTSGATIENNVIIQAVVYGIQFYSAPCNGVISNNTVDQAGAGNVVIAGGNCSTPGLITIENNIFESAPPAGAIQLGANGSAGTSPCTAARRVRIANNLLAPGEAITTGGSLNGCTDISGTIFEAPTTTFSGYSGSSNNNSYVLTGGSIAINAGSSTCVSGGITPCVPSIDFLGVARPQRQNIDIGAYELP